MDIEPVYFAGLKMDPFVEYGAVQHKQMYPSLPLKKAIFILTGGQTFSWYKSAQCNGLRWPRFPEAKDLSPGICSHVIYSFTMNSRYSLNYFSIKTVISHKPLKPSLVSDFVGHIVESEAGAGKG